MKNTRPAFRVTALLLAAAMLVPLSACNSRSAKGSSASQGTSSSAADAKPATVSIMMLNDGNEVNSIADSRVVQALTKATGVQINCVQVDDDKMSVMLAGGDLPDIVSVASTQFSQLIQGGNVIALDNLIASNGKDIQANIPTTLSFSKKYWSDGQDKIYFLPMQVGLDGVAADQSEGVVIRWDYYKDAGYPQVNNVDDLLNALQQMVQKHPKTADGKKVYAVSGFTDWGNFPFVRPMESIFGFNQINGVDQEVFKVDTGKIYNELIDPDTPYWKCMEFYYKANKMGIYDPDALTQKYDDFTNKLADGQLIYTFAQWASGGFNGTNAQNDKGFEVLPLTWGYQWNGSDYKAGWIDKCLGITKNCKNPEKAMDLLDYLYSYDGCRTLYSGVEGTDWTSDGNTPKLNDATIQASQAGGDAWTKTGIGFDTNLIGLSPYTANPKDNKPVNLFDDSSIFGSLLTPLQKDFAQHYNVSYPEQYFAKLRQEGKVQDQSGTNSFAVALLPTPTDDIKRTMANLDDLCIKDAAKIILSKSDAEFQANEQKAMQDFKSAGAQQVADWYSKQWALAVQKSEAVK